MFLLVAILPRRSSAEGGMITETGKVIINSSAKLILRHKELSVNRKHTFITRFKLWLQEWEKEIFQMNIQEQEINT